MVDRIQLNTTHWIFIDGQPQLVETGAIVDVPSAAPYKSATVLSPAQPAGTLPVPNRPTRVTPSKGHEA